MAEGLLRSQDRKYGTSRTADPVFFDYGEAVFCPLSPHHRCLGVTTISSCLRYPDKLHHDTFSVESRYRYEEYDVDFFFSVFVPVFW